ncbi:MAG: SGNH/GDSL hydrolase family protein [Candidatus Saccharimonadales bacterium]
MRQRQRLFVSLMAILTAVPLIALGVVSPANADPIPPTNWASASLSSLPRASHVLTGVDGSAAVGCAVNSNATTLDFKSFSATGTVLQSKSHAAPYSEFCSWRSALGKDGTIFTYASTNNGYVHLMQAWKDNGLVWEYTLPCGAYGTPQAAAVGPNGNLYVMVVNGGGSCSSRQLIGLTPTAQSGTTTPAVVLNVSVSSGGYVFPNGMAVYDGGLVLSRDGSVQYVDADGTVHSPISTPSAFSMYGGADQWFDATTDGRVFVATKADPNSVVGCQWPGSAAGTITAIEPSGNGWTSNLDQCSYVREIKPTYTGGVVLRMDYQPETGGALVNKVVAFDASGDQLWEVTYSNSGLDTASSAMGIAVDLNGNVAVQHHAMVGKYINGSYYRFPEIRFTLLSGNTGEALPGSSFTLRGDNTTTNGPSYMWANAGAVSIAKSTAYVVAYECTTWPNCDSTTTKLYPFTVAGLEMDYPRGAILRHNEPWKNYVALGDSFSSGEGVEPFISPSDTNGCHRSEKAYAKLLDDNPASRLNLSAFVACSGATTGDVTNGRNGEPSQLEALNSDVDVVTITIGGNDIGFEQFATACVVPGDDCSGTIYNDTLAAIANELPASLSNLYSSIRTQLGTSSPRILVIGYPLMIPDPDLSINWPNCAYLSYDEKSAARTVITQLNQVIAEAVAEAGSPFEYVDPNYSGSPFEGHTLCTDDNYFNGVNWPGNKEYSFHPNARGQDGYRRLVVTYLSS